jgi:hypothetical protein
MPLSFRECRLVTGSLATVVGLVLSGCATQRMTEPNVVALPPQGEPFEVFQQHDVTCRQYAAAQVGGQSPGQAAAASGVTSAAAGTGIGAAAGALLGSASGHAGTGAAIGAGTGLLAGSLFGSESGRNAAASKQSHYDTAYTQCMVAKGERIAPPNLPPPRVVFRPMPPPPGVIYVPTPGPAYVAAPPPVMYPPPPPPPGSGSTPPPPSVGAAPQP